jgi:ATP/maltotriose-dependent transcriptional regulator MalT
MAAQLADAVCAQGRVEEAHRLTEISEEAAAEDDLDAQIRWRAVRGKLLARRGELERAEDLAREAVRLAQGTDELNLRAGIAPAEVLCSTGASDDAATVTRDAIDLYEAKGNLVSARRARALFEELSGALG